MSRCFISDFSLCKLDVDIDGVNDDANGCSTMVDDGETSVFVIRGFRVKNVRFLTIPCSVVVVFCCCCVEDC